MENQQKVLIKQLQIEGIESTVDTSIIEQRKKRKKWFNALQKWSDDKFHDGTTPQGKCGFMGICNYCEGADKKNPCSKAMKNYEEEKKLIIDYDNLDFDNKEYL